MEWVLVTSRQTRLIDTKVWAQGTAGEVSQAGNIDVVIGISVSPGQQLGGRSLHIHSRSSEMGQGARNFRYLETTKEASLGWVEVTIVSTVGNGGVGVAVLQKGKTQSG